jgi:anti-sigma factor (TIGR02949 family)
MKTCTCREVIESLIEYLANDLPAPTRQAFEAHMAECPDCVIYLNTYQEVVNLTRACCCHGLEESSEVPEDLVQAILAARPSTQC